MHPCSSCKASVDEGDRFCPQCGAAIELLACPACGAQSKPGDRYCRECGQVKVDTPVPVADEKHDEEPPSSLALRVQQEVEWPGHHYSAVKAAESVLAPDAEIVSLATGEYEGIKCLLVATEERLILALADGSRNPFTPRYPDMRKLTVAHGREKASVAWQGPLTLNTMTVHSVRPMEWAESFRELVEKVQRKEGITMSGFGTLGREHFYRDDRTTRDVRPVSSSPTGTTRPSSAASQQTPWVKVGVTVIGLAFAYWMFSGNFWSPYSQNQFLEACEEQSNAPFLDCTCVVEYMKNAGYSPNELSGDDYPAGALQAGLVC